MVSKLAMDICGVFGANLRKHRLAAGLAQEALAAKVGVERAHISAMERGQQNVTLVTLWRVAEALGVPPSTLVMPLPSARRKP
jgi:transcriptional regulator with XRE-family HTH domain